MTEEEKAWCKIHHHLLDAISEYRNNIHHLKYYAGMTNVLSEDLINKLEKIINNNDVYREKVLSNSKKLNVLNEKVESYKKSLTKVDDLFEDERQEQIKLVELLDFLVSLVKEMISKE